MICPLNGSLADARGVADGMNWTDLMKLLSIVPLVMSVFVVPTGPRLTSS